MWQSTPLTLPLLLTGLGLLACAAFVWTRRPRPWAAREFVVVSIAIAIHPIGYALEIAATSLEAKLYFFDVEMIGLAAIPVTTIAFALAYVGRPLTRSSLLGLSVIPAIALVLVWTNGWHEAMLTGTTLRDAGGYVMRHSGSGWAWWLYLAYAYVCVLGTALIYLHAWLRGSPLRRRQARALLLGILVPSIANVVFHMQAGSHIDTTPFAYAVTVVAWTWALTRHGLLELAPVAHEVVLDMMTDAVIVLDAPGRVLEANRAARGLLGIDELAPGSTLAQLLGARHPALLRHLSNVATLDFAHGEQFLSIERRSLGAVGDVHVEGEVLVIRDTTLQRETEEAREAALAAAREGMRLRSEMLARTSHEVRTPLHGILGSAELLSATELSPGQRRWLDAILGAGTSLLAVVDDVLDLEQAAVGALRAQVEPFALEPTVASVLDLFAQAASRRGITLRSAPDADLPQAVLGDARRLRQMLSNLVGNAVKYADPGAVTVRIRGRDEQITFEVRDEGPGIDASALEHLFTPFHPGHSSGGTGLGLALTRQLAVALGGSLEVAIESVEGMTRCTVARLCLPLPTTTAIQRDASLPSLARASKAVLVVEDHAANAAIVAALLEAEGCLVTLASDGAEALAQLDARRFDLIFMDRQLPEMDGVEVSRRFRATERGGVRTPIVMVSADGVALQRGSGRAELAAAGIDDVLSKPFDRAALRALLDRLLGESASMTPPSSGTMGRAFDVFVRTASQDVAELREAAQRSDRSEVRRLAHGLHGASLFLRLDAVAQGCAEILREDDTLDYGERIERLASAIGEVRAPLPGRASGDAVMGEGHA